jgi:hypothetical protein
MAYQTDNISDIPGFFNSLRAFVEANGWTVLLHESEELRIGKNGYYVRMYNEDTYTSNTTSYTNAFAFRIIGSLSSDFSTTSPYGSRTHHYQNLNRYHFFSYSTNDNIYIVVERTETDFVTMGFGKLYKPANYIGGEFTFGHCTDYYDSDRYDTQDRYNNSALFDANLYASSNGFYGAWVRMLESNMKTPNAEGWSLVSRSYPHNTWGGTATSSVCWERVDTSSYYTRCYSIMHQLLSNTPNRFNGTTMLFPYYIFFRTSEGTWKYGGHVPNLRAVRIDNLSPRDIVTYGSDNWMMIPIYNSRAYGVAILKED